MRKCPVYAQLLQPQPDFVQVMPTQTGHLRGLLTLGQPPC